VKARGLRTLAALAGTVPSPEVFGGQPAEVWLDVSQKQGPTPS
jgi:hypothetical protein